MTSSLMTKKLATAVFTLTFAWRRKVKHAHQQVYARKISDLQASKESPSTSKKSPSTSRKSSASRLRHNLVALVLRFPSWSLSVSNTLNGKAPGRKTGDALSSQSSATAASCCRIHNHPQGVSRSGSATYLYVGSLVSNLLSVTSTEHFHREYVFSFSPFDSADVSRRFRHCNAERC